MGEETIRPNPHPPTLPHRFFWLCLGLALLAPCSAGYAQLHDMTDVRVDLSLTETEHLGKKAVYHFTSGHVTEPFNGVVVQGFAGGDSLRGAIRFNQAGTWNAWEPLYLVRSATDAAFLAAYRGTTYRRDQFFELRFDVEAGHSLELLGAGVFDNRHDERELDAHLPPLPDTPYKTSGYLIVPPVLIPRATWGAAPFIGTPTPLNQPNYRYITFHHAAGFGAQTREEGLVQVKRIQDFHQNGRGWSDIGYQFVMDQSGRLYQGRPFLNNNTPFEDGPPLVLGAHAGGANTGNIGVCVLGCYHPPEGANCQDQMTEAALDSLVTMFAYLSERYDVPPQNIRGHRDFGSTACPGDSNYSLLPTIRQRVQDLRITGNRPLGAASLAATVGEDGVVQLSWTFLEDGGITAYRVERVEGGEAVVVFEGSEVLDDTITDTWLSRTGEVTYQLRVQNAAGREQILAATAVLVEPPEAYVLAQSFPNPFQETTTIRYFLEQEGVVSITVFDALGRTVTTLVDEFQDGGRWYTASLSGQGLSNGTYYCRLQVEGFSGIVYDKTRTLLLLR